jgi:acetylornithine/N-succinyldiaminopimelate aminotransferase
VQALRDEGMLTVPAGDNVVRLLPPLIVDVAEIDAAATKLDAACAALAREDLASATLATGAKPSGARRQA